MAKLSFYICIGQLRCWLAVSPSSQKREKSAHRPLQAGTEDVMATGQQVPTLRSTAIKQLSSRAVFKHVGWKSGVFSTSEHRGNVMRDSAYLRQKQLGVKKRQFGEA